VLLADRVALITGAGQGIGRDIALAFAKEGARCVLVGRRAEPLEALGHSIEADGGRALGIAADVSSEEAVRHVFAVTTRRFGAVDVLVNNAGIAGPVADIGKIELAGWLETLAINLTGPWLCCREAATTMAGRGGGRIVNIGSISGKRPLAQRTPYCASKMGLLGLTRALALELGPAGINVNCISPGAVLTARLELLAEKANVPLADFLKGVASISALKRVTEGHDIAALCVYLASDAARNITGQDFTVDAGTYMG
jgi:NAD(P)-dependent dehydrogenase (short-subunit alcohol dehydrogenase family)